MKFPWTLVGLMAVIPALSLASNPSTYEPSAGIYTWTENTEAEITKRLASIDLPVAAQSSEEVMQRIRQYVTTGRRETEVILGRTVAYFPIFEHYLQMRRLPEEMKFLPMIESGLRPTVKSGAGAAGMWQLMSITARHYGMTVNDHVDERFDPYKSTEAAAKMLDYLYDTFGDWAMVLAAYNCGPGNVKKAIRAAGSDKYEDVKPFLPRETQRYVPAFIAAAYVANFYQSHGLNPRVPTYAAEQNRSITVNRKLTFNEVARATQLSYKTITRLNPAFLQGFIPKTDDGYQLVLPASVTEAMRTYLREGDAAKAKGLVSTVYVVAKGDDLSRIAQLFKTTPEQIKKWNALKKDQLVVNQELVLYLSKAYLLKRA